MKRILIVMITVLACIQLSGCLTVLADKDLPPGQEKKITGDKNAKDLAPGKNK